MAQNVWLATADGNYGTTANWSLAHVPLATENVIIPAGSPAITSGFAQSGVAIAGFYVEDGYDQAIGDAANYLSIDPNSVYFAGTLPAFIDINAANITVDVYNTAPQLDTSAAGLFLLGSNIATLNVYKGAVGLAMFAGETATVATINLMYVSAKIGESALVAGDGLTVTTWNQTGGTGLLQSPATTVTVADGELTIRGSGAVTTLNNDGATVYAGSSGTITNLNMSSGITDFTRSRLARTVTTPKIWPGAAIVYDPTVVTLTSALAPQLPVNLAANPVV